MKATAWTIGLILFFAATYIASYAANLEQGVDYCQSPIDGAAVKVATYRVGGRGAQVFFWPAFQADLRLRPERWPERSIFACAMSPCP